MTTETTSNPVEDPGQTDLFQDWAIDRITEAHQYTEQSLGLPFNCNVTFQNLGLGIAHSDVLVTVWKTTWSMTNGEAATSTQQMGTLPVSWVDADKATVTIPAAWTAQPGALRVQWAWTAQDGSTGAWDTWYLVRQQLPHYVALSPSEQALVQLCWTRWQALRDNHYRNSAPSLKEDLVNWNYDTVAVDMQVAVMKLNTNQTQPTFYTVGGQGQPFPQQWYGLLLLATLAEMVRQLVVGYLETPKIQGAANVPYADRSDYYNRWTQELDRLDKEVESQRKYWERANLDLGASAILVHGGMYGNGAMGMGNAQIAAMQRGWIQSGLFQPIFMMYNPNN